ncbi:3-deoxy-manno-octulosonate cytidylyltransferase [Lentisphaera araneosa HTCC2155]|uniref:3-deoxy-manno-octulosonate cytidylyltransferase n=1 Tax=Lentisphaera araneosa HTCC2155 TaxID=313628 RepID=A6DR44_9BACT|nr:hypothetical protein [Lentisphaera araneosa]EDM25932.1 3-deoxy-manno-octulosonate cytidylyltransferase [Lentisphaera araneosa HTCC2155]
MTLQITALLMALCLIMPGAVLFCAKNEKSKAMPRERIIGSVLTLASFAWAGLQGYTLLKEDFTSISRILPFLVPALAIGSCLFVDYLFTRGLGFALCLLSTQYLNQLFAADPSARQLASLAGYVAIILGMFLVGHPWMFRKALEKCRDQEKWRKLLPAAFALTAIIIVCIPLSA